MNLRPCLAILLAVAAFSAGPAIAQDKPVKVLVGLPPGGAVDLVARVVSDKLRELLGTPVIVENRAGAQTRIAVQALKAAAPDGATLLVSPGAIVTLYPHMFRQLGYDPFRDLAPVSLLATTDYGIAVPAGSSSRTLAQLVDWARSNPKTASFANPSNGSPQHFLGLLLGSQIGVPLEPVGFRGAADAMTALIGNQVPMAILGIGELIPAMQAGKVRVLATLGDARHPALPDVPTVREAGFADLQSSGWFALYAPGGTPAAVTERLNKLVTQALADTVVREKIMRIGLTPRSSTSRELEELSQREFTRWQAPVKASGYVAD